MAERTLFVLIGAGASHDCASDVLRKKSAWDLQPPLVTDLFAPRFTHVLSRYPLAQMAASTIRSHRGSSMALERFLREEFRDSSHALDRRKFHAIHFYFQDLLHEISCDYAEHPDNYDRLIEATERLPRVVYISLNYDTLLDDRLRIVDPDGLNKIDDYCNPDRSWSLLKPHGSVDWVQRLSEPPHVLGPNFAIQPPAELSVIENSYEVWRQVGGLRALNDADYAFYPALSAPLGAPDPLTCPASHIRFLEEELARQDRLDVLMLGYSGLDDEVLRIFRASGKPLGQIQAACGAGSQEALNALVRAIRGDTLMGVPVASGETFSQFVTGTGLGTYLAHRR